MHAYGSVVPFHYILSPVARLDLQRLANPPRNGRLSLARYRGMLHGVILTPSQFPYVLIIAYLSSASKVKNSFRCAPPMRQSRKADSEDLVMKMNYAVIRLSQIL